MNLTVDVIMGKTNGSERESGNENENKNESENESEIESENESEKNKIGEQKSTTTDEIPSQSTESIEAEVGAAARSVDYKITSTDESTLVPPLLSVSNDEREEIKEEAEVQIPSVVVTKSDTSIDPTSKLSTSRLDNVLSRLTSGFPIFVLSAALLGLTRPSTLTWVNNGDLIPLMLSSVMLSMGMTLQTNDFTRVLSSATTTDESSTSSPLTAIPAGVSCQYLIMPLTAFLIGTITLLPHYPAAFLGLILVGCSPGGTASNLVSLIAGADVALSVVLTSISTVLATGVTPVLVRALAGRSDIEISRWAMCVTTGRVVLLPVAVGMWVRDKRPGFADKIGRFAPFLGVLLVALMCGGVVSQNAAFALSAGGGVGASLLVRIMGAVLGLHSVGFLMGYLSSKKLFGLSESAARTISIETGMQNSALAVVLARSLMGGEGVAPAVAAMACLPGAFSATAHSCLGSALAVYWRWVDRRKDGGNLQ